MMYKSTGDNRIQTETENNPAECAVLVRQGKGPQNVTLL